MAFYMKPGQGSKMKTGNQVPDSLMGGPKMKPCGGPMMTETHEESVQIRYPGAEKRKGTENEYTWKGATLIPGYKKTEELSDKEKIKKALNE